MIYSPGNAAKQWIFDEIHRRFDDRPIRVLDLGCGNGSIWKKFAETHPNVRIDGVDMNAAVIQDGVRRYSNHDNVSLSIFDAQKQYGEKGFEVITALSALEHVVDHKAFLKTVWDALSSGGVAFLNYDVGHFRSYNIKERIMVPVSQLMAKFGVEGKYMKRVNDKKFLSQIEKQGFIVERFMKHNIGCLKRRMKEGGDDSVRLWVDFENKLNSEMRPEELDSLMLSTTVFIRRP